MFIGGGGGGGGGEGYVRTQYMYVLHIVCICMFTCSHTHMCTYTYMCTHTYMCTYAHVHTHIHVHTHTPTKSEGPPPPPHPPYSWKVCMDSLVLLSQRRIVLSSLAERMSLPSGENLALRTQLLWAHRENWNFWRCTVQTCVAKRKQTSVLIIHVY